MTTYLKTAAGNAEDQARLEAVRETVTQVIADVRARGDVAVREYSEKFDGWSPDSFRLDAERDREDRRRRAGPGHRGHHRGAGAASAVSPQHQRTRCRTSRSRPMPGVLLGQKNIPIAAAGAYVPGGRYPLTASAHMTIVTAKVAGVERVDRLHAADPRRDPRGDGRGDAPGRRRRDLPAGRRRRRSRRWPSAPRRSARSTCSPARATPTSPRPSGSCSARWASTCSPAHRDPDRRRRRRRPVRRGRRPAQPGRARARLAGRPHHHVARRLARRVIAHIDEILVDMPTARLRRPAWRDHGQVAVVDNLDEAYALADEFASRARADPHRQPAGGARQDEQLRGALPRRGHLRLLRGQGDRHQPRAADPRRGALHRWPLGRQVPQDRDLPGGHGPSRERRSGRALRSRGPRRALRGTRPLRRRPGLEVRRAPSCPGNRPVCDHRLHGRRPHRGADGARHRRRKRPRPRHRDRPRRRRRPGRRSPGDGAARWTRSPTRSAPNVRVATVRHVRGRRRWRRWPSRSPTRRSRSSSTTPGSPAPSRRSPTSRSTTGTRCSRVNVRGVFLMCRAFLPPMVARGRRRHHQPRVGERQAAAGPAHALHRVEDGGHRPDHHAGA